MRASEDLGCRHCRGDRIHHPVAGHASSFDVRISYRIDITNNDIPNLLNVLFGNISIRRGIKITGIDFTPAQMAAFGGPRIGMEGIRAVLNAGKRPLATTAIKPLGLSARELAERCGRLCGGRARHHQG